MIDELLTIDDIVNDKQTKIHSELFNSAVRNYAAAKNINLSSYTIIDLKDNDDYLKPSSTLLLSKTKPFKKFNVDLTNYWNTNYSNTNIIKEYDDILLDEDDRKYSEYDYTDYIKGRIYFKNKLTNKRFYISFDKFDKEVNIDQLKNTFLAQLNNVNII